MNVYVPFKSHCFILVFYAYETHICGGIASVLASSVVDHGLEPA